MSLVVCGVHPSVHAAHQASSEEISVSVTLVYNKINGIEPITSGELVREVAEQMEATIRHLNAPVPDLLPGYRVKILDGNAIAATEQRLKVLREISSAPLPGQSLDYVMRLETRDGLIVHYREYWNPMPALNAFGNAQNLCQSFNPDNAE
ncbi:nuclear transport factor 2 family protein [Nostoc sp. 'Lobaria pulmonaria (5183) cyanobiont']|uniref:nuclear transport factor 2 family protein n=1 Tax=Nostoc sp. 'Lobaria pulmonaria (5183) cyanobiont' TaxID=1618022 RepID=UPI0018F86F40|nr:hypothetical protein [Nostoc sp. 'Lobaria pulmonaria (5183) cyanobiont']